MFEDFENKLSPLVSVEGVWNKLGAEGPGSSDDPKGPEDPNVSVGGAWNELAPCGTAGEVENKPAPGGFVEGVPNKLAA